MDEGEFNIQLGGGDWTPEIRAGGQMIELDWASSSSPAVGGETIRLLLCKTGMKKEQVKKITAEIRRTVYSKSRSYVPLIVSDVKC